MCYQTQLWGLRCFLLCENGRELGNWKLVMNRIGNGSFRRVTHHALLGAVSQLCSRGTGDQETSNFDCPITPDDRCREEQRHPYFSSALPVKKHWTAVGAPWNPKRKLEPPGTRP